MQDDRHYGSLDLVRGTCACLVIVLHSNFLSGRLLLPSAYLSVDLFFLMSGFVIGLAYDTRLRRGFFSGFVVRRFLRLAPMWWAGLLFGLIATVLAYKTVHAAVSASTQMLPAMLFFPALNSNELFPLDTPGWSLFYEVVVNLTYAAVAPYLSNRRLVAVVAVSACLVLILGLNHGSLDGGLLWSGAPLSLSRVFFSFSAGLLVFRFHRPAAAGSRWLGGLLVAALVITLSLEVGVATRPYFDCLAVILALPAFLLASLRCAQRSTALSSAMGSLSYPLYTIHVPVYVAARAIWAHFRSWNASMPMEMVVAIELGCIGFALYLGRAVDPLLQSTLRYILQERTLYPPRAAGR